MARPYDDLPRQGEHLDESLDTTPTTNVRAQAPVHPTERSKSTERVHVLMADEEMQLYRLAMIPKDGGIDEGFERIAEVPEAGHLEELYARIPAASRYAVFERSGGGEVRYVPDESVTGDWTAHDTFDRVTIFSSASEAEAYADECRDENG